MQAEIAQLQEQLALKDAEIERLQSQLSRTSSYTEVAERGKRRANKIKNPELYFKFALVAAWTLDCKEIQGNARMDFKFIMGGKAMSIHSVLW